MNKDKIEVIYSDQIFLNPDSSPSTGHCAAFIGKFLEDKNDQLAMWLRVGDCHNTICLHKCDWDTIEEFENKIKMLQNFIDDFLIEIHDFKQQNLNK